MSEHEVACLEMAGGPARTGVKNVEAVGTIYRPFRGLLAQFTILGVGSMAASRDRIEAMIKDPAIHQCWLE